MATALVLLTLLLHDSGGITNRFYLLYFFHVILGAIVFDTRRALAFAGTSAVFLIGLVTAEYYGLIPHHPIRIGSGSPPGALAQNAGFVFSRLAMFFLILVGLVGFTTTLMEILRTSRGRILDETERRAELLHKVFTAQEEERARVARELHDQIGQSLSALRMKLTRLISHSDDGETEEIEELKTDVEERIEEVRSLSTQIRPPILEEYGLATAVEDHVKEVDEQYDPDVNFNYTGMGAGDNFTYNVDIAIYRVIQEAVHNALSHAEPETISVLLQKVGSSLRLQIYDDGQGFDVEKLFQEADRKFLGLQGMQERITHIGGELDISSKPEQGTRVRATIPLDE
jgi:signal transduction histidine kinase